MRRSLIIHPDSGPVDVAIDVEISRPSPSRLQLDYRLTGDTGALRLPPASPAPTRTDKLWRRTCFEAFLRGGEDAAYVEFNFSPSGDWDAYRFDSRRSGMRSLEIRPPACDVAIKSDEMRLRATVDLDVSPKFAAPTAWRLGVAAVLESADGALSYWALAHPQGAPDFHDSDCFTVELPAVFRR